MADPVSSKNSTRTHLAKDEADGGLFEVAKIVAQAVLIAILVRTFLFQPFNIPSGSLIPTLLVGDYLFVSKYAYGYSYHSLPWSPHLFSGRLLATRPKRGDIVVFKLPRDGTTDYIKRVIGLPGDRIQMIEGRLYINGKITPRQPIGTYPSLDSFGKPIKVPLYSETLPGSDPKQPEIGAVTHRIIERDGDTGFYDNTAVFTVPPDRFFMMGDNRDNSLDSRVGPDQEGVGYVPFENLIGRAEIVFFSMKTTTEPYGEETEPVWKFWHWPHTVRWDRIFHRIH